MAKTFSNEFGKARYTMEFEDIFKYL